MLYNRSLMGSIDPKIDWLIKIQDAAVLVESIKSCNRIALELTLRDLELINKTKLEDLTCKKTIH